MTKAAKIGIGVLCVVLLALGLGFWLMRPQNTALTGRVLISVNGEPYMTGDLSQPQEITITGENGESNTIVITSEGVYMKEASCPDQLCVQQGEMNGQNLSGRAMGNQIICLPNRVVIELELQDGASAQVDVPDA